MLDGKGITVAEGNDSARRVPWGDIVEVHIEPSTAGDDEKTRWLVNLAVRDAPSLRIDSVDVRGAADFEHKTREFGDVLAAIHEALAARGSDVRYLFGTRRGVFWAWRVALFLAVATGLFGVVVAIVSEEYEAVFYTGAFAASGILGLLALRRRRGPVPYNPDGFASLWRESGGPESAASAAAKTDIGKTGTDIAEKRGVNHGPGFSGSGSTRFMPSSNAWSHRPHTKVATFQGRGCTCSARMPQQSTSVARTTFGGDLGITPDLVPRPTKRRWPRSSPAQRQIPQLTTAGVLGRDC